VMKEMTLFASTQVAVLLTGEAFRTAKRKSTDASGQCIHESYSAQHAATQSLLSQVIVPIETLGATVDVLYTFPSCGATALGGPLRSALHRWFGNRVVAHATVQSRNVGHSWQLAYKLLSQHIAASGRSYDYVLSVRHDLRLLHGITTWPVDLSQLLFLADRSGVKLTCETVCRPKIDDKMLWVPRRWLPVVLRLIGHDDQPGDDDFNPHYLVSHFLYIPKEARHEGYHNHGIVNTSCADDDDSSPRRVPPHLRAAFKPHVGLLSFCKGGPLYRFAPDRKGGFN